MPAGTSFGSDAGTQGRQLEPRRILQPHGPPLANVAGAGRHPVLFYERAERLPRPASPHFKAHESSNRDALARGPC